MNSGQLEKKSYVQFDPLTGYPAGRNIYYECLRCGDVVPSLPTDSTACTCKDIAIDVDYGRVSVKDHGKMKVFSAAAS